MRISDWSSDVCSSDLEGADWLRPTRSVSSPTESSPASTRKQRTRRRDSFDSALSRRLASPAWPVNSDVGRSTLFTLHSIRYPYFSITYWNCKGARSEELREGKECVRTCRSRGLPYNEK